MHAHASHAHLRVRTNADIDTLPQHEITFPLYCHPTGAALILLSRV